MTKIVKDFPEVKKNSKYLKLLDGNIWKVDPSDYNCKDIKNLQKAIRVTCDNHNYKLKSRIVGDDLYIQAIKRT